MKTKQKQTLENFMTSRQEKHYTAVVKRRYRTQMTNINERCDI